LFFLFFVNGDYLFKLLALNLNLFTFPEKLATARENGVGLFSAELCLSFNSFTSSTWIIGVVLVFFSSIVYKKGILIIAPIAPVIVGKGTLSSTGVSSCSAIPTGAGGEAGALGIPHYSMSFYSFSIELYSKPRNCSPSPCLPKDVDEFVAMICSFF
jgi:hypothetical protein